MARKLVLNGPAAEAVQRLARSAGVSPAELIQRALRREDEAQREERERPAREAAGIDPGSGLVADLVTNERGDVTAVHIRRKSPDAAPPNYASVVDTRPARKVRVYDLGESGPSRPDEDEIVLSRVSRVSRVPLVPVISEPSTPSQRREVIDLPVVTGFVESISENYPRQDVRDDRDEFVLPVNSGRMNGMVVKPSEDGRIIVSFPQRDDRSSGEGRPVRG